MLADQHVSNFSSLIFLARVSFSGSQNALVAAVFRPRWFFNNLKKFQPAISPWLFFLSPYYHQAEKDVGETSKYMVIEIYVDSSF